VSAARLRTGTPIGSCPACLAWGVTYGSASSCRACYDFTRTYPAGECPGCLRFIALKKGHCRACWLQAAISAHGRRRISPGDFAPGAYWQLTLAGTSRLGHTGWAAPAPLEPTAPPGRTGFEQLELFTARRPQPFDQRHWVASRITNDALEQTRAIAEELAGIRGWNTRIIAETHRALAIMLAGHHRGDLIDSSTLSPALHSRDLSVTRTAEILSLAGLLNDDRTTSFTTLTQARLQGLPPAMAQDVEHWLHTRLHGSPRSHPRDEHTVRMNLNRVHPLLREWASRYQHLRQVTRTDITTAMHPLTGHLHRQTFTAVRSLFAHAKKTGRIFADPTHAITSSQRPLHLLTPLNPEDIQQAITAASTPAARLVLALAAVHAARPRAIRELHLDDIDLPNRCLSITGRTRPLDDLTHTLLTTWLRHRAHRWPVTANPHLIINQQTTMSTKAVSENWLTGPYRTLTATLERLRMDRHLEEALTHPGDPKHLAAVFAMNDTTAIRYAALAQALLPTPAEHHHPQIHEPKDPNTP